MFKRATSLLLAMAVLCTVLCGIPLTASAADRYTIENAQVATGMEIITEARKWAGTGAIYRSGVEPWEASVKWRTGYADDGQVSFECSGFVGRVLNDCGFRSSDYMPSYGKNILSQTYKDGYIAISIEELVNYGTDITDAVLKAKTGDYSGLQPGDVIGWTGGTLGRHVILYAGLNNGVPWMVEMTGKGFLDRAVTAEYQAHFQYGARFAAAPGEEMLILETYPTHCEVIASGNTIRVMNMPCDTELDPDSQEVQNLKVRLPMQATALVRNCRDQLWYRVRTASGDEGYVPVSETEYLGELYTGLYTADVMIPTIHTQGTTYSLHGKVFSSYSSLTEVSFFVYAQGNSETPVIGTTATVVGNQYTLGGSYIDKYTSFGKLPAGQYTCFVSVQYENYYVRTQDSIASNTGTAVVYRGEFSVTEATKVCEHQYAYAVTKEPNCSTNGIGTYTCTLCNACYVQTIFSEGHYFTGKTTPASLWEGEKVCYTCKYCKAAYTQYTGTEVIGDIDANHKLNVDDVVALLLHISMPELYPMEPDRADLDRNGIPDVQDAVLLLLYISMPDLYPIT
ncbi:MAG: dockerin type I repeat-containing protein [Oscillospiraceae bacterium]|nr:dockerin type I repeat-containing protein [Oscillospiraceae bacterium]